MAHKPIRTYEKGIGLPFGGTVDSKGTTYVSDGGLNGQTQGDIAVFPPGKMKPSQIKYYNVYNPHGIAVDAQRNIFVAMVYGSNDTFVVEFPHDAYEGIILPLNDLSGVFCRASCSTIKRTSSSPTRATRILPCNSTRRRTRARAKS